MIKNAFISVISEEENRGAVEFQIFSSTNKIQRLISHLEVHKKDNLSQRGEKNRVRYKELIGQLNIQETKTR
ncbi:hypothetical protein M9H77_19564 [Catharanthus roseus]|uniref:Uncharacterized protein n=1 Tax=Catharanthus roseus TaxID=4058 RepID=A0ACC0BAP3_CATRO|nr:hypothetical protein M9H77_19564 [Catharanthus roseus]